MPKCYSDQERTQIKNRLLEEAERCLAQNGMKRTTVDELVRRVKIPKGTFYLFYSSKELLFFDVILRKHDLIEQQLYHAIQKIDSSKDVGSQLTDIIVSFYKMAGEEPVLRMLHSDEIELLVKKLPQGMLEKHLQQDHSMVQQILGHYCSQSIGDMNAITAAFRAIYFSTLHKTEIGEEDYEKALYLLVSGLISKLV